MVFYRKLQLFFQEDLWNKPLRELSGIKGFFFRCLRIIAVSFHGFIKDDCVLRASALTYFTLLGLVPLFAISIGVAQGFGLKERLQAEIMERFSEQNQVLSEALNLAQSFLDKTKGGFLAIVALAFLFWSVIKLIGNMEDSFNRIWHSEGIRSWRRKLGIYFFLLFLFPFFFIFSNGLKIYFLQLMPKHIDSAILSKGSQLFYSLIPFGIIWLFFMFIYSYLPKKEVRFFPAMIGGFIAGATYQVIQWGYGVFQVGVTQYSAVYGSFAALPFFLISLQLGWMVFLYGAEMAHAVQYPYYAESEKKTKKVALHFELILALWITLQAVERMLKNKQPFTHHDLYLKLGIPESLAKKTITLLLRCQIFTAVKGKKEELFFVLNGSVQDLKVLEVMDKILTGGESNFPIRSNASFQKIKTILKSFHETIEKANEQTLMRDLI